MSKFSVTDLAADLGISTDDVLGMLRSLEVVVRAPSAPLTDDQAARVRARWERVKRERAAKAAAPAAAPARRRKAADAAPADSAAPADAADEAAPKAEAKPKAKSKAKVAEPEPVVEAPKAAATRRRRAADLPPEPEPVVEAPVVVSAPVVAAPPAPPAPAPVVAAPVAHVEVVETPSAAPASATATEPTPVAPAPEPAAAATPVQTKVESEAAAAPAAPAATAAPVSPAEPVAPPAPRVVPRVAPPSQPLVQSTYSSDSGHTSHQMPDRPRPRPIVPGAPRPRPAASGGRGGNFPPRPVASATPGGGPGGGARRDDRRPGGGPPSGGNTGTGGGLSGSPTSGPRRKKGKRGAVDQEAVSANISRTMRQMGGPAPRRRGQRDDSGREELEAIRAEIAEREKKLVRVNEFITVSELADILKVPATQIVSFAFKHLGLMVTINQRMDFDQIELIASEFGFVAEREEDYAASAVETVKDAPETLKFRPPVVTIMGHVDHGKTSLLDYVRKANVVAGEAGGITQHIGAYHVTTPSGKMVTFLDTPGHEAFTAMRARGAQVTDIVILVVAADDSIVPQTIEAISHAKNAGVPIIVAINKCDLPAANPMKVKQELLQHGVVLEEFGGQTLHSEISAKKGTGVSELIDQILLQSEILDLKANPDRRATGSVVEAQLDAGKGPVATILVQAGTLRVGDDFICGLFSGRVRALLDERGKAVKEAGPAIPVQVLGMVGVPMAGDQFLVVEDSSEAREIAQRRERLDREAKSRRTSKGAVSLEDFMAHAAEGERRSLKLLIKADQGGPAEALADALAQMSNAEVEVEVIQRSVGAITEGDILLAKASGAIIIGFHVRPDNKARSAADREGVEIKLYKIIYEAVADVKLALEGMLRPDSKEVVFGEAEVREVFKVSKIGTIAGCIVRTGNISRAGRVRVLRDGKEVYEGTIGSLRRFKDDVKEVKDGFECGIGIENFNDVKVGDMFECYRTETVARTLASSASE